MHSHRHLKPLCHTLTLSRRPLAPLQHPLLPPHHFLMPLSSPFNVFPSTLPCHPLVPPHNLFIRPVSLQHA